VLCGNVDGVRLLLHQEDVAHNGSCPETGTVLAEHGREVTDHGIGIKVSVGAFPGVGRRHGYQPDLAVVLHHQGEGQETAVALELFLGGSHSGPHQILQVRG
jgi:hypothetical protein